MADRAKDIGSRQPGWQTVAIAFLALVLAAGLLSRVFLWSPYWIPSGSMKPTLLVGDYVIAVRMSGEVARGDVLIVTHPTEKNVHVARVVGLAGDRVQLRDGVIRLNGSPVDQKATGTMIEPFIGQGSHGIFPRCANAPAQEGGECQKPLYRETLEDGRSWQIVRSAPGKIFNNTPVFTVPDGHLMLLGDNRDNARDSRWPAPLGLGFVPVGNVRNKVWRILMSEPDGAFDRVWNWRPDRFWKAVE
jgi:signal peptidase I